MMKYRTNLKVDLVQRHAEVGWVCNNVGHAIAYMWNHAEFLNIFRAAYSNLESSRVNLMFDRYKNDSTNYSTWIDTDQGAHRLDQSVFSKFNSQTSLSEMYTHRE